MSNTVGIDTSGMRKLTAELCMELEDEAQKLADERRDLDAISELLRSRGAELEARDAKVSRREQEVMNIRQIAADRKAQLETANQVADAADVARRKAEVSQRMAETEKTRLEEMVETLIREKRELTAERDGLREQVVRLGGLLDTLAPLTAEHLEAAKEMDDAIRADLVKKEHEQAFK